MTSKKTLRQATSKHSRQKLSQLPFIPFYYDIFSFVYLTQNLRERCMVFILVHFDEISRTAGFEEMGRTNVELGTPQFVGGGDLLLDFTRL